MIRFQAPQLPSVRTIAAYFAQSEETRWYSNRGPCHKLLVERLERFLGNGVYCVPVANGTLGLMVALRALIGAPDRYRRQVLLPSFTFAATVNAVLWSGFDPVFVDVEERSWHLDPACVEAALAERAGAVAAVLACSTFGVPPPATQRAAWENIARAADVGLLVDSAAGFGAIADDGERLCRQGDAEVFSFHATKPFAIGEGGLVTTADGTLATRIARLTNFGFEDGNVVGEAGINAKLSEWSAATALAVLDGYHHVLARRRETAERIFTALAAHGYERQHGAAGAAWQFVPVLAPSAATRRAVLDTTPHRGIEVRSYFSIPLHRMPTFASTRVAGSLRCTEDLAERALSLPMANDLSEEDIEAIINCLAAVAA